MTGCNISRLIAGGQTGVDRAALDVALELGIPCGGWCPKGRKAEDGVIHDRYPLAETPSGGYSQRTKWNIRDSDGTLILAWGKQAGGTLLTVNECIRTGRPHLEIDLSDGGSLAASVQTAREWVGSIWSVACSTSPDLGLASIPQSTRKPERSSRSCSGERGHRLREKLTPV
jgi:hypothetical protein